MPTPSGMVSSAPNWWPRDCGSSWGKRSKDCSPPSTKEHDADMLRLASAGTPHAGVAYCHGQKYKVGPLVLKILALASRLTPETVRGRVVFL
jgi:hypothetical protein